MHRKSFGEVFVAIDSRTRWVSEAFPTLACSMASSIESNGCGFTIKNKSQCLMDSVESRRICYVTSYLSNRPSYHRVMPRQSSRLSHIRVCDTRHMICEHRDWMTVARGVVGFPSRLNTPQRLAIDPCRELDSTNIDSARRLSSGE